MNRNRLRVNVQLVPNGPLTVSAVLPSSWCIARLRAMTARLEGQIIYKVRTLTKQRLETYLSWVDKELPCNSSTTYRSCISLILNYRVLTYHIREAGSIMLAKPGTRLFHLRLPDYNRWAIAARRKCLSHMHHRKRLQS